MTLLPEDRERATYEQIAKNVALAQRIREEGLSQIAFAAMNRAHVARGHAKESATVIYRAVVKDLTEAQRERAAAWRTQIEAITKEGK
ncbi:MAG TPA: hypothetical protein VMW15_07220 [Terracidiphilus sp.]|nr:hypothetical protein [Terracidiphilus sp.]